jgi:hypothetical protein
LSIARSRAMPCSRRTRWFPESWEVWDAIGRKEHPRGLREPDSEVIQIGRSR